MNYNLKSNILYIGIPFIQAILILFWVISNNGVEKKIEYIENVGNYEREVCSNGNETLLSLIIYISYILLFLSVLTSFRGRNSKYK